MAFAHLAVAAVVTLSQAVPAPPARKARPVSPDARAALEAAQVGLQGLQDIRLDMVAPALQQAEMALADLGVRAPLLEQAALEAHLGDWHDGEQEPADSLYRQARQLLNRNRYNDAAKRFKEFRQKNPNSDRVADALYFEALALYRGGDINQLREAQARLKEQEQRFPSVASKSDSKTLKVRIWQSLAERGDRAAAESLAVAVRDVVPPTPPTSGREAKAPRPPREPTPPRPARCSGCEDGRSQCDNDDDDDDVKMTALNAIMQMDPESAVPILKAVLAKRDSASVCLRRRAVFIASQKRSSEVTAILLDAARTDPDLDVRLHAVQWLSQVRSEEAVVALDSILRTARDFEMQEKAIFALSQMRSERASASLRAYAERSDVPVAVREKTIFWLGQQRSPENAAFLRTLYAKLQNSELKEKCLFSLSQMKDQGNERWLLELAGNERETIEIRKRALFYAGQAGAPTSDLTALYDKTRDREMKEQLIFVYSQRKDPQAVDKMMDIARRETDPELRKKAIFWLGQSRDPRAAAFLVELINQP